MEKIELKTIGGDFEFFMYNKNTGEIISAENYIKGTKENPFKFDKENEWFTTSKDNVLAEVTIPPVEVDKPANFLAYLTKAVAYISNSIPKELGIKAIPSANLDEKWLLTEQAQHFGKSLPS